jgi:hypothetical protein
MTTSSCIPAATFLIYGRTAPPAPVQDHYDQLLEDLKKVTNFLPLPKASLT